MPEFTLFHAIQCGLFFGIGFLASAWLNLPIGRKKSVVESDQHAVDEPAPDSCASSELEDMVQCVVESVQTLADGMRTDVQEHSQSVERINNDLTTISGVADVEGVARVIAHLIEANRHLDTRLSVAEARLLEQSQQLRSHRVEARTDALTGLPNRRVFDEELKRLFDHRRRLKDPACLIMIDIDHFKEFNDRRGHQAGDACLRSVGEVIWQTVQPLGGIVVRYGGEEFAVLFPKTEIFDAKIAAQRINHKIEKLAVPYEETTLEVTVSLGVAELFHDATPEDWLSRADRALYDAKRRGRNRACWHDSHGCHEIPKGNEESSVTSEEHDVPVAMSGREEFLRDVDRRLAMFHRKQNPLGIFIVNIDPLDENVMVGPNDFKAIEEGVHEELKIVLREMDHVCKLSKMQYGALLPTAGEVETAAVAERARNSISQLQFETPEGVVRITVTCGVAEAMDGDSGKKLVSRAEACVRLGGEIGGNVVIRSDKDGAMSEAEQETASPVIAK